MSGTSHSTLNRGMARPPRAAERLLLILLPDPVRDNICGDLSEIFSIVIVPGCGAFRARLWYWRQVISSMRLFFRFRRNPQAALELWKGRFPMQKRLHVAAAFHPGISMHHIPVGGSLAGFLFVLATIFIFGGSARPDTDLVDSLGSEVRPTTLAGNRFILSEIPKPFYLLR